MIRLFYLAIAALSAGFGLGYVKFFLLTDVSRNFPAGSKDWIIQVIGALLTIGPFLMYIVAAAMASAYKKRYIMLFSGLSTALVLFIGMQTNWYGGIWLYLFITGLLTGIFNPAKNAAVPMQAIHGNCSTETVNGVLNTTYILGLLGGIPAGAKFAEESLPFGEAIIYISFLTSAFFGFLWRYEREADHLLPFKEATKTLIADTGILFKKNIKYITASSLLWGVGCTASLAIVAYSELAGLGDSSECSLMAVYPVIGIISGNMLAAKLVRFRTKVVPFSCFFMTAIIWGIPHLVNALKPSFQTSQIYWFLASLMVIFGFFFGVTTNLIEAEYFRRVYNDKREGSGAALLSAGTSLVPATLGLLVAYCIHEDLLSLETQFTLFAIVSLFSAIISSSIFCVEGDSWTKRRLVSLLRHALKLRYNVTVSGFDNLKESVGTKGILFAPNHPAETDPIILCSMIWRLAPIRPVITERYYHLPIVHTVMRIVRAISMPDMEKRYGYYARQRLDATLNEISAALERGENILFYPSGHLMRSGFERLKGNSGLQKILQNAPNAKVVMVRTRGLRGSIFSAALTGTTPPFLSALKTAIKVLVKNLIFFIPRRNVTITFEVAPQDLPINGSAQELNSFFELWYNKEGEDKTQLVSYSCWSNVLPEVQSNKIAKEQLDGIPQELQKEIFALLAPLCETTPDKLSLTQHLGTDLGMDSLTLAQVLRLLEENYGVTDLEIAELQTVASVVIAAMGGKGKGAIVKDLSPAPKFWSKAGRPAPYLMTHNSVQEAFIRTARRMRGYAAMGDEVSGVISWHKLEIAVQLLAKEIRTLQGDRIGVMLPSSCGASIVTLAVLFAGKVPVMINWTMGQQGLQHALNLSGVSTILTAGAFLDKIDLDLSCLENHLLLLEQLKKNISLGKKVQAIFKTFLPWSLVTPKIKSPDETFAILFTSGSETVPKGVPLSHKNMLTNVAGAPQMLKPSPDNVLLGFLPPFHSFGLMATISFPLLTGVRVAYHPNPNESRFLAKACKKWQATITAGTPTFIRGILDAGELDDFKTLKLLFVGAESVPQSLSDLAEKMNMKLIEGYGITECSPIVSGNIPGEKKIGVGKPFPGVEILIVDTDNFNKLPDGETGLIFIHGDSVFSGYLGTEAKNPFVEIDGKRWFNSGDLGKIQEGNLVLAGRLKRFAKIAGEMVSLPAVENALAAGLQTNDDPLVVLARESTEGNRTDLVLFTTSPLSRDAANDALRAAGFPNLVRIKEVREIDSIPVLGTGKTDLRSLHNLL
ncbi:MAG: MFS transporter [Bdellovibrionota bacterium]